MSNGKGKGPAPSEEETTNNDNNEPSSQYPSLLSRVTASATGLTRNTFGTPSSKELNDHAATAFTNTGKGSSAAFGSGSSAWAESSKSAPQPSYQTGVASGIRQPHSEQYIKEAEDEFSAFLDGTDAFLPWDGTVSGGEGQSGLLDDAWKRAQPTIDLRAAGPAPITVDEQERRDGEAVLAMLSDSFAAHDPFEASEPEENFDWGLSAQQISQLRSMTKDLFPPLEPHGTVSPDHPLNLKPGLGADDLQSLTSSEHWREQWEGVLTAYADEVWGGLLPLVEEARREVEEMRKDPEGTEQPKALRRLGAILNHLRKS